MLQWNLVKISIQGLWKISDWKLDGDDYLFSIWHASIHLGSPMFCRNIVSKTTGLYKDQSQKVFGKIP